LLFVNKFSKNLPKVNYRPIVENYPNQVTLLTWARCTWVVVNIALIRMVECQRASIQTNWEELKFAAIIKLKNG
jgi:hypothetical protein